MLISNSKSLWNHVVSPEEEEEDRQLKVVSNRQTDRHTCRPHLHL